MSDIYVYHQTVEVTVEASSAQQARELAEVILKNFPNSDKVRRVEATITKARN